MSIAPIEESPEASVRVLREQVLARLQEYIDKGESPEAQTIEHAAKLLERNAKTIKRWLREGRLPERAPWAPDADAVVDLYLGKGCVVDARSFMIRRLGEENTPDLRTLQRGYAQLPPSLLAYIRSGYKGYFENTVVLTDPEGPLPRNFRWETDWIDLKLRALPRRHRRKLKVFLIVVIDCGSRLVMGVGLVIGRRPDRFDVLQVLYDSVCRVDRLGPGYGAPIEFRCDGGLEFLAADTRAAVDALGAFVVPTAPYSPNQKGRVERVQGTLKRKIAAEVGASIEGARDKAGRLYADDARGVVVETLVEITLDAVSAYPNHRIHSELAGRSPAQAWLDDPTPIREIPPREAWLICQARSSGIVQRQGIAFNSTWYLDLDDKLACALGERLAFRHSQVNPVTIEVIRDDEWLCTAFDVRTLDPDRKRTILEYRRAGLEEAGRLRARAARRRRLHLQTYTASNPRPDDPNSELADTLAQEVKRHSRQAEAPNPEWAATEAALRARFDPPA